MVAWDENLASRAKLAERRGQPLPDEDLERFVAMVDSAIAEANGPDPAPPWKPTPPEWDEQTAELRMWQARYAPQELSEAELEETFLYVNARAAQQAREHQAWMDRTAPDPEAVD
jgi:hypothetical protein